MPLATLSGQLKARNHSFSKHIRRTEESEQMRACSWLKKTYPNVIFYSDALGVDMSDTQRIKVMAMRSDKGQCDINIDFPSRGYHGLRIEFKPTGTVLYKKDGTLRKASYVRKYRRNGKLYITRGDRNLEQSELLKKYNSLGYLGRYAIGIEAFKKLVNWYMENEQQTLF